MLVLVKVDNMFVMAKAMSTSSSNAVDSTLYRCVT